MWPAQSHTAILWLAHSGAAPGGKRFTIAVIKDSLKSPTAVGLKTQTITSLLYGSRAPLGGHLADSRDPRGLYRGFHRTPSPPIKRSRRHSTMASDLMLIPDSHRKGKCEPDIFL